MAIYTITSASTPSSDWTCDDWIAWHRAMKADYGKQQADVTWLHAWNDQSFWSSNYSFCKYGAQFNAYVNAEKLPVSNLLADVFSGGTRVGDTAIGTVEGAAKIPLNLANVLKWLVPTILMLAVIGALIYFGRKYEIFKLT